MLNSCMYFWIRMMAIKIWIFFMLNITLVSAFNSSSSEGVSSEELTENVTITTVNMKFIRRIIEEETADLEKAINSSLGDIGSEPTLFCTVVQFRNIYYYYGVIGNQYHYGISTLGSCLYHCVAHNHERKTHHRDHDDELDCKAVNYFAYHKACQLLNNGVENLDTADRRTYGQMQGVVHAFIQNCYGPGTETSTPGIKLTTTKRPTTTSFTMAPIKGSCGIAAYPPSLSAQSEKNRIIRGQEARPHSWPWVILFNLNFGNQQSFCGGTLLRIRDDLEQSDIVLTAAHCVTRSETQASNPIPHDPVYMNVVGGEHRRYVREYGEIHRRVSSVRFHSRFRFTPHTGAVNDVALLKLQSPIPFSDVVRPICLPNQNDPIPTGSFCVATGWGRNDSRYMYVMPDALQQLVVPLQDAQTCAYAWAPIYSEREMICAGSLSGTASTCQGDSGGMLACRTSDGRWVQHGVVSFGVGGSCLQQYKPAVFARVSSYVDWIRKNSYAMSILYQAEYAAAEKGHEFIETLRNSSSEGSSENVEPSW